ncbi:MAG: glycosyltransferase [Bacteroidota bacterium]
MKIVLINSIGKQKWGGGEKWMIMAAGGLMSLGHDVVAICRKESRLARKAREHNIPVEEIGANSDFDVIACFQFCNFFKSFKPDVVIGCQNKDWRVGALALKLIGSRAKVYSRQGLQLLKNSWWYKWTIKLLSDGIITNTYTIKKYYDSFLPVDKNFIQVISNGVETAPADSKGFDYSQFFSEEEKNPIIILSTGRLAKQKGFKFLISAASDVIKDHPNAYFFLAGQGKLESEIKEQIKRYGIEKNFILLGFFEDIHPLLKNADIFVFSSLYEGMPNSLLEAMAHGLPVVSTNVNGVTELIKQGVNGFTVSPGAAHELSETLRHVIENMEETKQIGHNARDFVGKNFGVQTMVENLDFFVKNGFNT